MNEPDIHNETAAPSPEMAELMEIQSFIGKLPQPVTDAILNCAQSIRRLVCMAPPPIAAAAISLVSAENAAGVLDIALEMTQRQQRDPRIIMPGEKKIL